MEPPEVGPLALKTSSRVIINLAGLPGMSIPCGLVSKKPVGMEIIGNYLEEPVMLQVAHQFQNVTDWHKAVPGNF